ncbi:MAG: hypothetical protein IH985_05185 [Planctomycetes bacterium]|nr:hypothetical protein [Planctomycetota bacterium]MCH8270589.1 hypothetical protein [Planctomycetota bacterium]
MTNSHDMETLGGASAAFVASGIGCAALGLLTTLAQISVSVKNLLNWWNPAGPLSGKSGLAVIIWIASWIVLHAVWKNKAVSVHRALTVTLVLIAVGVIGTFPTFFEMFGH